MSKSFMLYVLRKWCHLLRDWMTPNEDLIYSFCMCMCDAVCVSDALVWDRLPKVLAQLMQHATAHCITPQRIANHWNKRQTQFIYDNGFMLHTRSMCVCVCVRERERKRTREIERKRESPHRKKHCQTRLSLFHSALLWALLKTCKRDCTIFSRKNIPADMWIPAFSHSCGERPFTLCNRTELWFGIAF